MARNITVIQLATSTTHEPVSERSVIEMLPKVYDCPLEKAFLITIPKIGEAGKN
ncbi:MAG: hypothetical protein QMD23_07485 [Candidatus Bathyarchaeia archaeon]|nr:hypothetical protein [Candidatus Bathyarchaeia archaeon]